MLSMSKADFFNSLSAGHGYSDTLEKNLNDTAFYITFDMPAYNAQVTSLATVKSTPYGKVEVRVDSLLSGNITGRFFSGVNKDQIDKFKKIKPEEFQKYFEQNFIKPLTNGTAEFLYYDNKAIEDSYQKER